VSDESYTKRLGRFLKEGVEEMTWGEFYSLGQVNTPTGENKTPKWTTVALSSDPEKSFQARVYARTGRAGGGDEVVELHGRGVEMSYIWAGDNQAPKRQPDGSIRVWDGLNRIAVDVTFGEI